MSEWFEWIVDGVVSYVGVVVVLTVITLAYLVGGYIKERWL